MEDFGLMIEAIRKGGMLTMSTPFDEFRFQMCRLNLDVIKLHRLISGLVSN